MSFYQTQDLQNFNVKNPYAYMTNRNLCSDIWTITSIEKTSNNL